MMGPRIFTVREANALIPKLEAMLSDFDAVRDRIRKVKSKVDLLEMLWGDEIHSDSNPDHREHSHYLTEVDSMKREFDALTRRVAELEVVLKSVDAGLVDFYGVIDGHLVFLCWKRGEPSVEFYHHIEEGFQGRREIAADYKRA